MSVRNRLTVAALAAGAVPAFAFGAVPLGIDGTFGAEWGGAFVASVGWDSGAATNNFGAPGNVNHLVAYNVFTRQDADFLYVAVVTNSAAGGTPSGAAAFTNLYFGGNTSVGFEVQNNRMFRPGINTGGPANDGYYPLAGLVGGINEVFSSTNTSGSEFVTELAVPKTFFALDPLGSGFSPLTGAPGANFTRISLSQSYGYSVAGGGVLYDATNRLGPFFNVPAPGAAAVLGLGGLAMARRRR